MYVNNGERLDFGETATTTTRRRVLGAISFLYHHDSYIHARIQAFSSGLAGGGGGGPRPNCRKKL